MTQPLISAVVLTWNDFKDTEECVYSVLSVDYDNIDVYIVDNGSDKEYTNKLYDEFSENKCVEIHSTTENLGFAGGMNFGLEQCLGKTDYIWLLNNDVVIPHDFNLIGFVDAYESVDSPALFSPEIRIPESDKIWFENGNINQYTGTIGHSRSSQQGLLQPDYIPLCATLVREDIVRDLGGIPEEYFLYYEDVDYSLMAEEGGYRNYVDREQHVFHHGGGSAEGAIQFYYDTRNHPYLISKYSDRFFPTVYLWYLLTVLLRIVYRAIKRDYNLVIATIRGLFDAVRGKKGRGRYP